MKKTISIIYQIIICLNLFEYLFLTKSVNAFFPVINEPSQQELRSTSIKIGHTAIQLIEFGQNDDAIKLLKLAIKLNPNNKDLWTTLAEAQIRENKKLDALSSLD